MLLINERLSMFDLGMPGTPSQAEWLAKVMKCYPYCMWKHLEIAPLSLDYAFLNILHVLLFVTDHHKKIRRHNFFSTNNVLLEKSIQKAFSLSRIKRQG